MSAFLSDQNMVTLKNRVVQERSQTGKQHDYRTGFCCYCLASKSSRVIETLIFAEECWVERLEWW